MPIFHGEVLNSIGIEMMYLNRWIAVTGIVFSVLHFTLTSDEKPRLLLSTIDEKGGIYVLQADTWNTTLIRTFPKYGWYYMMDVHYEPKYVYFKVMSVKKIFRSKLTEGVDSRKETIVTIPDYHYLHTFAVDWVHNKLYWLTITYTQDREIQHNLHVANMDGTDQKTIASWDVNERAGSRMVLDPYRKYVYVQTWNGIERIGMDGSGRMLVDTTQDIKYDIDLSTDRLYFMSRESGLTSVFTNGTNKITNLTSYFYLADLRVYKNYIFMGGNRDYPQPDYFMRYNIINGSLTKMGNKETVVNFRVYEANAQTPGETPCEFTNNGGCPQLCLPKPEPIGSYSCQCSDGYTRQHDFSCIFN